MSLRGFLQTKRLSRILIGTLTLAAITLSLAAGSSAQSEGVLHVFTGSDGNNPYGGLVFDAAGNLYGTTSQGGAHGFGTVFKLSLGKGGRIETVLHSFTGGADGANPTAGLIFDTAGNLYGTTTQGGLAGGCFGAGCGVVFRFSPARGSWHEKVLYTFSGGNDGSNAGSATPGGVLTFDGAGNLYGTTFAGGPVDCGTVFKLSPKKSGKWNETVLYGFDGDRDGCSNPTSGVIFNAAGDLYGTTAFGGSFGWGTVFQLSPNPSGPWSETLLYEFTGLFDGTSPGGSLIFDADGNLFGTTFMGGNLDQCGGSGCGVVFELSPTVNPPWQQTLIHTFEGSRDGANPTAGLIFDPAGNLFGTTTLGGDVRVNPTLYGAVFELSPMGSGNWNESVLHFFRTRKYAENGALPFAPLIRDSAGRLYGTTAGSANGSGAVVFRIRP